MSQVIPIDDPADPRIAAYRDVREADLVGRQGRFIAEGEVVLRVLLTGARHEAESLLVAEKRLERLAPLLALAAPQVPVYAAGQAVLDAIVGFHIHRGILALGRRAAEPSAQTLLAGLPPRALVLALFGIANHDNVGGLFRNAAAFGASAVLLDGACCDPLYRKAIRVSVGGALVVPFARFQPGEDALGLMRAHGLETVAMTLRGELRLDQVRRARRAALLLGAEGPGLDQALIAEADVRARIPMSEGFDSLNVAVAAGVALHHLAFAAG